MRSLTVLFTAVLLGMFGLIFWASNHTALFDIPREVYSHPWFITTLFDAYLAFVAFWAWLAWKEGTLGARLLWLFSILLWGNPAIAFYMLRELARVRREGGGLDAVFSRKRPGELRTPAILLVLALGAYLLGAKNILFA